MRILPQNDLNENDFFTRADAFFKLASVGECLKAANVRKNKGVSPTAVMRFLFSLVFAQRSMNRAYGTSRVSPDFQKDTAYRFLNSCKANWSAFLLGVAIRVIRKFLAPLTSESRLNAIIVDDTFYGRERSKDVELLANVFDHAAKGGGKYKRGFRLLSLVWTDGVSQIPLLFRHMSSEKKENRYQEMRAGIDKRTSGYRARKQAVSTSVAVMLEFLGMAKKAAVPASYVLFDSWFSFPSTIMKIRGIGFHVIGRLKDSANVKCRHGGKLRTLKEIFNASKKRRGRSRYLLSVPVAMHNSDGLEMEARVVYVRNRSKRNEWIALLSTDTEMDEKDIIAQYGKRWDIEVFFKVCKSFLKLTGEFQQLSYDAVTAHTAIVFLRYTMLSVEKRMREDSRTLGGIFYACCDEMADISFADALWLLVDALRDTLREHLALGGAMVQEMVDRFLHNLPPSMRLRLAIRAA